MAVVPVAVLAIAGTVGLTLRPFGGSSRHGSVGPATGSTAPSVSASRSPGTTGTTGTAAASSAVAVDLAQHTLVVRDAQEKIVRTLSMTAGSPAHPTQMGTFTVAAKLPSKVLRSSDDPDAYTVTVPAFIDLGPNAPAIYAASWADAFFGKENTTHGDIGLATDDAAWLYHHLAIGDTIRIS